MGFYSPGPRGGELGVRGCTDSVEALPRPSEAPTSRSPVGPMEPRERWARTPSGPQGEIPQTGSFETPNSRNTNACARRNLVSESK
eukprot:4750582-Amphidinium_carterae.1